MHLHIFILSWISITASSGFQLVIIHTNDVHARFEPINARRGTCTSADLTQNTCYGGAAKRLTAVRNIRNQDPNVIFVNGGDEFQGTIWYTILKWEPIAQVLNALKLDAMTFGNHEFDDGLDGLLPFTAALDAPILNANIDARGTPLEGAFQKSIVKTVSGERIGIVGYTTAETPDLSNPGPLLFNDVVRSVREEVAALQRDGINKIIAVGHAGFAKDKQICREVAGVDIVVGGHTNTFLYTGTPPAEEIPQGEYPTVIRNAGNPCLVVQDYAFGKYLGHLKVEFNLAGVPTKWEGNPILLDNKFVGDPEMEAILQPYLGRLEEYKKTVVGATVAGLDGDRTSCRLVECNMGSLLADAAVAAFAYPASSSDEAWSPVAIGIWNGGGVRDFSAAPGSNLTLEDVYTTMPFGNTVEKISIKGKHLREALEQSVKDYSTEDSHGKFLQFSGLRVVYDLSKPNGRRVHSVLARCNDCAIPKYEPLDDEQVYPVVTISFLANGGDGYSMIKDNLVSSDHSELLDIDVVQEYLKKHNPILIGLEGRISFVGDKDFGTFCSAASRGAIANVVAILVIVLRL